MLEQFLNHIEQQSLCERTNKILLAVSGGLDSMVMLHLFVDAGFQVGVAHCNFQLRGSASDGDEIFVKEKCKELKVVFFSKRFDTEDYATEMGQSIQMAARDLRYSWFNEIVNNERYDFLATAHHLNDTLETILLNLSKGSGLLGMSGIPLKNKKIIRPMLFASHDMIKNYATSHQVKWREDLSNSTDDYQRNFIRHQVVPKLKELNPSLEETLQKSLLKMYGALELMSLGKREFEKHFKKSEEGLHIPKRAIEQFENSPAVLWETIHSYGFNIEQCQSIIHSLHGQPGKRFISAHYYLIIDRDEIVISESNTNWESVSIESTEDSVSLGPFSLNIEVIRNEAGFSQAKNQAVLDEGKLKFPLTWRKWKPGDYFYPLGMEHKRKLSDFLIDKKVSVAEKNYVTVLESDGQIVWVVGYRIDNRFKLTSTTQSAVAFTVRPHFI
jgi:tRNA(Ile)-lysidine synthase